MFPQSQQLFEKSKTLIPGGVNSPVRAFGSVGGSPIFIERAKGAYLIDVDGREYIDFINSWGPMILGHQFEPVVDAVAQQIQTGFSYGCPTENEYHMAAQITKMAPWVEKVRMVNSGTEACLSALRVARGYTGRNKFIKFAGNYHGHADPFLVKAGSGLMTFAVPGSAGVPEGATQDTLIARYNDLESVSRLFEQNPGEIAAIFIEPVAGNMGCIPPAEGFLEGLRDLCTTHGALLVFDEVMTGFRLAPGGAAALYGITPDLVTYGKVIGGGMPVGAFGGREEIMNVLAPLGPVYQAGTLSGNPVAMAAGLATLRYLEDHPEVYDTLAQTTEHIERILRDSFAEEEVAVNRVGSMISVHFGTQELQNYDQAAAANNQRFNQLFHHLLSCGVYLPPSAFETWFISQKIGQQELDILAEGLNSFRG